MSFGDLGTNCLEIAQSRLEDAARCARSAKNFVNEALDRHEVSLRSDTMIGLVWCMRWHERRGDWGWLSRG
jgi:hypothetical protein